MENYYLPGSQIKAQPSASLGSRIPLSTWPFNMLSERKWWQVCEWQLPPHHWIPIFSCVCVCVCVARGPFSHLPAAVIALFCRQYDIIKDNDSSNNKEKAKPSSERSTPEHHSGGLLRSKVSMTPLNTQCVQQCHHLYKLLCCFNSCFQCLPLSGT